jgi:type IV secretory pathway TrbD component
VSGLLVVFAVFGLLWWVALAVWAIAMCVLEPMGVVKDPDECHCPRCRGMRPE